MPIQLSSITKINRPLPQAVLTALPFPVFPLTFLFLKIISKTKRVLRGEVNARTAALEAMRRLSVKTRGAKSRRNLPS